MTGQERKKLRKPEPKKLLTERVKEAMQLQMEMEMAEGEKKAQWYYLMAELPTLNHHPH